MVKNRLERGKRAQTTAHAPVSAPLLLWCEALDADPEYLARFCAEEILEGKVTLLHESGRASGIDWANPERSHLWNFNLHYLEFLIPLAAEYRRTGDQRYYACFRDNCLRWMEDNRDGAGDGWHPYTISLRLTNLWVCMDGFGEILKQDEEFLGKLNDSMYAQYLHLQRRLELHLLGNHYFENLKAVLLGSLYFGEQTVYDTYKKKLSEEIAEQILEDGVHCERSLMYHKIILEDVVRTAKAVSGCDPDFSGELLGTIRRMADAMDALESGIGRTPLFNDAGDNVARPMRALLKALEEEFGIVPSAPKVRSFPTAGYYCLENARMKILMDAGEIAPAWISGHGHCDALSFELSLDGCPVFVNSGTGQYQGEFRPYFRSTAAHNTVVIDGQEQSECWGEHRVARRISQVSGSAGDGWVEGSLLTCRKKRQKRRMELNGGTVRILDTLQGQAQAYFHLAPPFHYTFGGRKVLVCAEDGETVCEITLLKTDVLRIHREGTLSLYAPEFGEMQRAQTLEVAWEGDGIAHEITMEFRI